MTNDAISIDNVSKTFGEHRAVDDLSLCVPEGSIYGFIGPNGSGKTTTLRMIMGIYYPDAGSGSIRVLGEPIHGAANDTIGYLPEERGLYRKMKVNDLLKFYLELKGRREFKEPIEEWLSRLDLAGWGGKKIQELSKGMAQKVQFISAVIHEPRLVILDEPFSGLDPVNADVIRDAIIGLRRKGTTVVFSTHDMSVAEKMCDYIFMIFKGRKVLDGTLDDIQRQYGHDTVRVRLDGNGAALQSLVGVERIADFGRLQELRLAEGADTQDVLTQLIQRGRVAHFEVTQPSLHDIFVRIARPAPEEEATLA